VREENAAMADAPSTEAAKEHPPPEVDPTGTGHEDVLHDQNSPAPGALTTQNAVGAPPLPRALSVSPPRSPPVATVATVDGDGDVAASASVFRSPVRIRDDHFGSSNAPGESPSVPQVEADDSPVRQREWEEHASHSSLAGDTPMSRSLEAINSATQLQLSLEEDTSGLDTPALAMELADRIVSQGGVVAVERTILPQPGAHQPTRVILPKSVTGNSDCDTPETPNAVDLSLEAADTPSGSPLDSSVGGSADLFVTTAPRGDESDCGDSSSGEDTATTESSVVLVDCPDSPGMKVHNARPS
jgi:hypothetical protein